MAEGNDARHEPVISPIEITRAAARIAPWAHRTPVVTARTLNDRCGGAVFIKCENFQKVGAFKFRGAMNALSQLSPELRQAGVITHSSGNHGQALACAGQILGAPVCVVMPRTAPAVKREATLGYGARVVLCEPNFAARDQAVEQEIARHGYQMIHPFNDWGVIAGQGTAALELIQDAGPLDLVICPVGGGGLLAGTALAAASFIRSPRVVGAEPDAADDARRSLESGTIQTSSDPSTIADGLRTTSVGARPFAVFSRRVERIVTVSENQIIAATRFIWERLKLVAEPSSAVPIAALLAGAIEIRGLRVGVILSGGNVDLETLLPLMTGRAIEAS